VNVETRVVQERAIRSLGFVVVSSVLKNVFYFVGDFIRKENKVRKSEPSPWKQPRCRPFKAFASRNKRENPTFGKDKFKRFVNKIGLKEVFVSKVIRWLTFFASASCRARPMFSSLMSKAMTLHLNCWAMLHEPSPYPHPKVEYAACGIDAGKITGRKSEFLSRGR